MGLGDLSEDVWVVIARHIDVETVVILSGASVRKYARSRGGTCRLDQTYLPNMSLSDKSPFTAVCTKFHGLMHTLPLSAQVEGKAHGIIKTGKSKMLALIVQAW